MIEFILEYLTIGLILTAWFFRTIEKHDHEIVKLMWFTPILWPILVVAVIVAELVEMFE